MGQWPLFPEARAALRRLQVVTRCVAMTNSDRVHGDQVQGQLGFPLTDWVCASRCAFIAARRILATRVGSVGRRAGPQWWHVSAYADYDLETAGGYGLTTVFVERSHARAGEAALR